MNEKRIEVGTLRSYLIPRPLAEFQRWVEALLETVPEEYRTAVKIEVEPISEYGDPAADLTLYYLRPATAEEMQASKEAEAQRLAREIARYEARLVALRSEQR